MIARLISLAVVMPFVVGAAIGALIWDHNRQGQALKDAESLILRASDVNALAEAMGCPERAVSGDLVKPLIGSLTDCAKRQRAREVSELAQIRAECTRLLADRLTGDHYALLPGPLADCLQLRHQGLVPP